MCGATNQSFMFSFLMVVLSNNTGKPLSFGTSSQFEAEWSYINCEIRLFHEWYSKSVLLAALVVLQVSTFRFRCLICRTGLSGPSILHVVYEASEDVLYKGNDPLHMWCELLGINMFWSSVMGSNILCYQTSVLHIISVGNIQTVMKRKLTCIH
jgi:hypothetical protein